MMGLHRFFGAFLGLFIIVHLGVHVIAFWGPDAHANALGAVQGIYRNRFIEPLLIAAIIAQAIIGGRFAWRRLREPSKKFWQWAQILSGAYLAFFLIIHAGAALMTRHIFNLDTNFYWPAGTLNVNPFYFGFMPYYFLGVVAFFTHVAAAIHFSTGKIMVPRLIIGMGAAIALFIIAIFSGVFFEIVLPPEYAAYFTNYRKLFGGG